MAGLASADELRLWLGGISEAELSDARADLILEGVSGEVLEYTNRVEVGFSVKAGDDDHAATVNGTGTRVLLLPDHPVTDVTKIVEDPAGAATELAFGYDYEWDEDGIVVRLNGRWACRRRWYVVSYARGIELPPSVRDVILRVAARAVENPEGLTQEAEGNYSNAHGSDDSRFPSLFTADRAALYPYRL